MGIAKALPTKFKGQIQYLPIYRIVRLSHYPLSADRGKGKLPWVPTLIGPQLEIEGGKFGGRGKFIYLCSAQTDFF